MKELFALKIECQDPWYSLLANGTKQVEGRKGLVKYRKLKPGDFVLFVCPGKEKKEFIAKIRRIDVFKTLDDYLHTVTVEKALPGIESIDEARQIYYQWSTPEEIEAYGFLGIWIEKNE